MKKPKPFAVAKNIPVLLTAGVPDSSGEFFTEKTKITFRDEIPVTMEFDRGRLPMGFAKLRRNKKSIKANIRFIETDDSSLLIKFLSDGLKLYPAVGGLVVERKKSHITKAEITSVAVVAKNTDPNIPPLHISIEGRIGKEKSNEE